MKKKVIYLIGTGRSGTTLLGIMLDNAPSTFDCGELKSFTEKDGIPPNHPPSSKTYQFWTNFRIQLGKKIFLEAPTLKTYFRKYDFHTGFLANYFNLYPSSLQQKYDVYLRTWYHDLFEVSGAETIIDSSKYANRAISLARALPFDLYFVQIKRHPVHVVQSFSKQDLEQEPKGWWSANLYYFLINLMVFLVKLKLKHHIISLRYEDLIRAPAQTLRKLQAELNIDLEPVIAKIHNKSPLKVGYIFEGNRIRLNKSILFDSTREDKKMTWKDWLTYFINWIWY